MLHKYVSTLPAELEANSIYFVRRGVGFDMFVTNQSGTVVAYPINNAGLDSPAFTGTPTAPEITTFTDIDSRLVTLETMYNYFYGPIASDMYATFATHDIVAGKQNTSQKGEANGYAALNSVAQLPMSYFPLAITADIRLGTSDSKIFTVKALADAFAPVEYPSSAAASELGFNYFFTTKITLTANLTMGPPAGGYVGKTGEIEFAWDGLGAWVVAWHSNYILPDGFTLPTAGAASVPYRYIAEGKVRLYHPSKWSD